MLLKLFSKEYYISVICNEICVVEIICLAFASNKGCGSGEWVV